MMKTNFKYLFLITVLSLLPFVLMFSTSLMPHTQDGSVHLARMAAHFKALEMGQFPPRWAGDLNYGYGMPIFIFMYPLPYFLTSAFIFLTGSLVLSYKLVVVLSFILSGFFMYLFLKKLFDQKVAFLGTVFYQFAPFRLVEANIRGDIGEIYTYTFLPLVLWGILKKNILVVSLGSALLILSHNSISLVFFTIALGFALFSSRNLKEFFFKVLGLFWGLLLSTFYWVPALFEHRYTYGDLFMKNVYKEYFTPFEKLFLPNFLNSHSLNMGDVPVQIGIVGIVFLILSVIIFLKNVIASVSEQVASASSSERNERGNLIVFAVRLLRRPDVTSGLPRNDGKILLFKEKLCLFSLLVFLVSLFFTQPISSFFWEKIPLLRQFQFPWRFVSVMVFTTALQCAVVSSAFKIFRNIKFISKINERRRFFSINFASLVIIFITIIIIISTITYWKTPFGYDKIKEADFWNYPLTTTYYGETDTIWSEHPASSYPKSPIEIIGGVGEIKNIVKRQTTHQFTALGKTDLHLIDYTWYFPGWRVFANAKEIPVEFQDQNHRGIITFRLPQGKHIVKVEFTKTKDRLISEIISGMSLFLWLVVFLKISFARPPLAKLNT